MSPLKMPASPAPWREAFLEHISTMSQPSPTFVLSTLHRSAASDESTAVSVNIGGKSTTASFLPVGMGLGVGGNATGGSLSQDRGDPNNANGNNGTPHLLLPRARTCVYRGLWGDLPPNDRNPAPRNPPLYESDLPVFTTDARMEKALELVETAPTTSTSTGTNLHQASPEDPSSRLIGTGGGGPVEAVFWAEKPATQWRLRGNAWIFGPDADAAEAGAVRGVVFGRMRLRSASSQGGVPGMRKGGPGGEDEHQSKDGDGSGSGNHDHQNWSWAREVTGHFGNMSPLMRGSFKRPPPGAPVAGSLGPKTSGQVQQEEVEDLEDEEARRNFRAVVIVPTEVDQVDLSDPKRPRRWLYVYKGESLDNIMPIQPTMPGGEIVGDWEKCELWA